MTKPKTRKMTKPKKRPLNLILMRKPLFIFRIEHFFQKTLTAIKKRIFNSHNRSTLHEQGAKIPEAGNLPGSTAEGKKTNI